MADAERVRTRSKWYIVCSILNTRVLFIHPSVQFWIFECSTLNTEALNFHLWILMSFYVRMWTHSELHWPFFPIIWYSVDITFNKAIKISLHLIWPHTHWFRNTTQMKQEGQHIGATYRSILKVLLKQYRSPTDPNKFKSATIISVDHFQITMRHDLDRWPFDPKINRAHPWLMGSKCMKFHDHRWITKSVMVRKPFSNIDNPWPWPLTFWPQNQ